MKRFERDGLNLVWSARTDIGKVRQVNEDALLDEPGMYVVADGMGGHTAGDVASDIVCSVFATAAGEVPVDLEHLERLVALANQRVHTASVNAGHASMGTTLVGAVLFDNAGDDGIVVVNVGDSRCYAFGSDGDLRRLTRDHSVVQELLDAGSISLEEARRHPERNVVTRAVGVEPTVAADFFVLPHGESQRLLLCSDGLSGQLGDDQIRECLADPVGPDGVVEALLELVLDGPAPDNVTAIVVDIAWQPAVGAVGDDGAEEITGPRPARTSSSLIDAVPIPDASSSGRELAVTTPISEVPT